MFFLILLFWKNEDNTKLPIDLPGEPDNNIGRTSLSNGSAFFIIF